MRNAVALLAILAMACNQAAQPRPVATPSPVALQSPSPSANSSASPSGFDLPLTTVGFSCRLPIGTPDGHGAFISFPSATVSLDPNGNGLQGNGGAYYDRAFSRWLPVNRNSVSSIGASYAYLEPKVPGTPGRARLHVVDVSSGNDRLYELGAPGNTSAYVVVDFAPEGIWLHYAGYEGPGGGLFLLDLATGAMKDAGVPGILEPVAGGNGVFWFTDAGPNPQASAMGFMLPAEMQRFTISNGKTERWFSKPGSYLRILGTDLAGHPIFAMWADQGTGNDIWLALSPSEAKVIGLPQSDYQLISDSHGVWLGSTQGTYLYSEAGGIQKVSNQPGFPANGCF